MATLTEYITAYPNSPTTRFAYALHARRPRMGKLSDRRKGSAYIIDANELITLMIDVMVLHREPLEVAFLALDTLVSEADRELSDVAVAHVRKVITRALPTAALKAALAM